MLTFPIHIPFVQALGFELHAFGDGQAELRLDLREVHLNSWSVAHGGVLMTLLDVAMAHAARSTASTDSARSTDKFAPEVGEHGPGVATIEMKTTFMRPAEGTLRAIGKLLDRTTTLAFTEGSVYDGNGRLCAHATGTFKFLRALPTTGSHSRPLQRANRSPNPNPNPNPTENKT